MNERASPRPQLQRERRKGGVELMRCAPSGVVTLVWLAVAVGVVARLSRLRGHVVRPSVYLAVSVCRATGPAVGVTYIVRLSEIDTRRVLCTVVGLYNRGWACRVRGLRPGCAARGPDRGPPLTRVRSRSASAFRPPDRRLVRGFPVAVLLNCYSTWTSRCRRSPALLYSRRPGPVRRLSAIRTMQNVDPSRVDPKPRARRRRSPVVAFDPRPGFESRVSHE